MDRPIRISPLLSDPSIARYLVDYFKDSQHMIDININHALYSCDIILADGCYLYAHDLHRVLPLYGNKTYLISNEKDESNVTKYLQNFPINHLVGKNSDRLPYELAKNIDKFISNNIWGIEKYLSNNAMAYSTDLTDSATINDVIDDLISRFNFNNSFDTPKDYLKVMANELLTNAFYNTSNDSLDREKKIILTNDQKVTLKLGADESFITMSIQDRSGQLTKDKVLTNINRAYKEKTPLNKDGGAGLGLYLTFQHANQLIFNNKKGEKSEIICIIDCNKRFKRYRERITSFHFNEEVA